MKALTTVAILLMLSACSDPIVMIPGGKLKGELTAAPTSWDSVPDVVQLEMRPSDPYSINIWAVTESGNLYIATRDARWLPMLEADNRVVFKVDGSLYELTAVPVTSDAEKSRLVTAYTAKYDYEMDEETETDTIAYQLVAR